MPINIKPDPARGPFLMPSLLPSRPWSKEEDQLLLRLANEHGQRNWKTVRGTCNDMGKGRIIREARSIGII
jgi:hypothetical protein